LKIVGPRRKRQKTPQEQQCRREYEEGQYRPQISVDPKITIKYVDYDTLDLQFQHNGCFVC